MTKDRDCDVSRSREFAIDRPAGDAMLSPPVGFLAPIPHVVRMVPHPALLFVTLIAAQPAEGPKLARGQELVYRGSYSETAKHDGAPFQKAYDLESRVFVREVTPRGLNVAYCTILKTPRSDAPGAARFALASVNSQGGVRLTNGSLPPLSLDGPPALECAGFIGRPGDSPDAWIDRDVSPPMDWRIVGQEHVHGVRCLKLVGQQESDWERPAVHRPGWRRTETVWLGATTGIVERLERDLQCRRIAAGDSIIRSCTEYELQGGVSTFPGPLGDDRQNEIKQAVQFQQDLHGLQASRTASAAAYAKLIGRIDAHLEAAPATPFRAAIQAIRLSAEAGRKGEPPPPAGP
jgi:hypothetical protein